MDGKLYVNNVAIEFWSADLTRAITLR